MNEGPFDAWDALPAEARPIVAGVLISKLRRTFERRYRNDATCDRAIAETVNVWRTEIPDLAALLGYELTETYRPAP